MFIFILLLNLLLENKSFESYNTLKKSNGIKIKMRMNKGGTLLVQDFQIAIKHIREIKRLKARVFSQHYGFPQYYLTS